MKLTFLLSTLPAGFLFLPKPISAKNRLRVKEQINRDLQEVYGSMSLAEVQGTSNNFGGAGNDMTGYGGKFSLCISILSSLGKFGVDTDAVCEKLFNPSPPTWMSLANLPSPLEGPSVGAVGNKIIAAAGFEGAMGGCGQCPRTRIYDIPTDTWSLVSDTPGSSSEGAGVVNHGLFYVIGGRNDGFQANWSYDIVTDSWAVNAPLPTGRTAPAVATIGKYIYAIGGRTNGGGPNSPGKLNTCERYDTLTDSWSACAPMPTSRSGAVAVPVKGKIYVLGGFDSSDTVTGVVEVYDPFADAWTTGLAPMPTPRGAFYGASKKGHEIFVIGGWDGGANPGSDLVESYDPFSDTWDVSWPPMPAPRAEHGTAYVDGSIYVVGGAQPGFGASVNNMEKFTP